MPIGYLASLGSSPSPAQVNALRASLAKVIAQVSAQPRSRFYATRKLVALYERLWAMRDAVNRLLNAFVSPVTYEREEARNDAFRYVRDVYQSSYVRMRPYRNVILAARAVINGTVDALTPGSPERLLADQLAAAGAVPAKIGMPDDGFRDALAGELKAADAALHNAELVRWLYSADVISAATRALGQLASTVAEIGASVADILGAGLEAVGFAARLVSFAARNWPVLAVAGGGYWYWKTTNKAKRTS